MAEALLLKLDLSALLCKGARRAAARERKVGSAVAPDGVAATSLRSSTHSDETATAEAVCDPVCKQEYI